MKTFKAEETNLQKKNFQINNKYWLGKMYDEKCSECKKISVFGSLTEYAKYNNLMQTKLYNESYRNGVDKQVILDSILNCELYRNTFAKNPKKQRLHEKVQYNNICEIINDLAEEYPHLKFVVNGNEDCNRFVVNDNGNVVSKCGKRCNSYKESKLFDYVLTITKGKRKYTFYLLNKYTHEKGGSQDNTRREMQQTHKYCLMNDDANTYFCFILDGGYWKEIVANIRTKGNIIRTTSFEMKNTLVKFLQKNNII